MSQQNELGGGQSGGGGLPTSGAESQVGVVQDRFGNLHKKGQQYQNLLLHALSLPAVQKSLAQDGNLRMRDIAKLNMVSKEIGLDPDKGLQKEVAFGHFARLRDYPYLYRYDPVYDPAHGFPPQNGGIFPGPPAGFPARDFHYVQPLSFGDQTNSNPTFPQEWALAELKRLTPAAIKELVIKALDRGVGGPPYHSVPAARAVTYLPLTAQAVASDGRGPVIPGLHSSVQNPQQIGRYELPRTRHMLAGGLVLGRPQQRADLRGDGILLFDRMGTPGVSQLNPTQPGKISRYQVATQRPTMGGGVAGNPFDLT